VDRVAAMTDDRLGSELGHHRHDDGAGALDGITEATSPPGSAVSNLCTFWDARPVLRHLYDFARARGVAPLTVLGVALARVVAATPAGYVLPPLIGGPGSMNFFLAVVGPSGAGKGAGHAAAEDALDLSGFRDQYSLQTELHTPDLGSGEGVAHQYVKYVKKKDEGVEQEGIKQIRESVLFTAPEIDQLTAVGSRQGATLMAILRKGYSGEALSFAYADPTKRLHVQARSYRMALTVGVQPGRAAALLDDTEGGTPQRFLWVPATDPEMPRERPAAPERPWTVAVSSCLPGRTTEVAVCAEAKHQVTEAHWRRSRGEGDVLDGHALYTKLKVAAALAALDGHLGADGVTAEDWRLAGVLMDVSDATRAGVQAELRRTAAEGNKARGQAEAVREIVKAETVDAAAVQKAGRATLRVLEKAGRWLSTKEIRAALPGRIRPHLGEALDALVLAGSIECEDIDHNGQSGRRYRISS
jgi:hypothetical protein